MNNRTTVTPLRQRRRVSWAALAVAVAAVGGCGGDSGSAAPPVVLPTPTPAPTPTPTPTPSPTSTARDIDPATTDPALTAGQAAHFAINPDPAATARNRLFVMLPGTGGFPRFYRQIVRTGAARGYHSIGLTYPNAIAVDDLCAGTSDPDCTGNTRREIITGEDRSSVVAVNPANAITGRLVSLLTYLHRTYPNEGWGQYLSGTSINWSLVTVAGHSQGAGHAAYLAKLQSLDRTVMFSGPSDVPTAGETSARWFSLPNITPASRQYGFTHRNDTLVPYNFVVSNWTVLGLGTFGAPVNVDGAASPYGNSHMLFSLAAPNPNPPAPVPDPEHSSPVVDAVTPLNAQGGFLYEPVWIYLAFP